MRHKCFSFSIGRKFTMIAIVISLSWAFFLHTCCAYGGENRIGELATMGQMKFSGNNLIITYDNGATSRFSQEVLAEQCPSVLKKKGSLKDQEVYVVLRLDYLEKSVCITYIVTVLASRYQFSLITFENY